MTTPANPHDLTTWLRAQVDEDEATTRELLYWAQQTILTLQDSKLLGKHIPGWHDWPKVERMCRVRLAEVDAKRRILDFHEGGHDCPEVVTGVYPDDWPTGASHGKPGERWSHMRVEHFEADEPCPTQRLLALPYADRPGFREEWRP